MIRPYASLNVLKPQVPSRNKSESNESLLRLGVEEQPLSMTVATAGCTRMVLVGAGTTAVPGRREGDYGP
jgi:hypothetical protein